MQASALQPRASGSHVTARSARLTPRAPHNARAPSQKRGDIQTCMAHPRRVAKVASQIQREISEMFIFDKVVQAAICPEKRAGLDDKLSAVASITHVYVSNDLQVVKVFVSVYSDEQGKERAISNLKQIAPYVRSQIGQAIKLRLTPEIRFEQDDTYDELEKIQEAIGQDDFNRYIAEAEAEARGQQLSSSSSSRGGLPDTHGAFADDDDEDDAGFFDISDADADAGTPGLQSAAPGEQPAAAGVSWSRHDPQTFFAVDVDEDEDLDDESAAAWYNTAGPFDDLFGGSGDSLAQPRQAQTRQQRQQKGSRQQKPRQQQKAATS